MNSKKFTEAMSEIDNKYVDEAIGYKKKNQKPQWGKWAGIAACLLLIVGLGTIIPSIFKQDTPEQLSTGAHLEFINVELIEWESNGFKAIVVDTGNSSLFPIGAKLTVVFREQNTEIVLDDGTSYGYGEIQIADIGWDVGTVIDVGFGVYEEYAEEKEYENKVYAYHVELSSENETVSFHDKTFNKADLSEETLEWIERYNALSPEEQLAISSIPEDLYELCGYGNATEEVAPTEADTVKYLDKTLNKSDLSAETLEWLEWFNGLSETEQLSVSFVPHDILELCGYIATDNSEVSGHTD